MTNEHQNNTMAQDPNNVVEVPKAADETDPPPMSNNETSSSFSPDDLIALVRAVKFAHPEMSIRDVRNEISGTMANSDQSYAFLKEVQLNDVKKVWKKALKGGTIDSTPADTSSAKKDGSASQQHGGNNEGATTKPKDNSQIESIVPQSSDGVLRFYTVGDGSVKTLAENYSNHFAGAAVVANQQSESEKEKLLKNYTHFFLEVPAERSGSRPHQALINFNDNKKGGSGNKAGKGKGKKSSNNKQKDEDGREIFKVQMAAPRPGMENADDPMLLYNADRSARTFLHPPSPPSETNEGDATVEDDQGYYKIKELISSCGTGGALGATGGQKAYFWGFITNNKTGPDIVSIDIESGLAPTQQW